VTIERSIEPNLCGVRAAVKTDRSIDRTFDLIGSPVRLKEGSLIKTIVALTRRQDLSAEEFSERWLATPGPAPALHYVQSHRISDAGGDAAYDGFASLWCRHRGDVRPAVDALLASLAGALSGGSSAEFSVAEVVKRDTPARPGMVKLVFFFVRRPGMTVGAFQDHWLRVHGPLALEHVTGLRRYVQNHTLESDYARAVPPYDGLVEAWFDDLDALAQAESSPAHAHVRDDEPNFLDVGRVTFMPVIEHVLA
jgi:uncharacterized protein (TIGR02118 family)